MIPGTNIPNFSQKLTILVLKFAISGPFLTSSGTDGCCFMAERAALQSVSSTPSNVCFLARPTSTNSSGDSLKVDEF